MSGGAPSRGRYILADVRRISQRVLDLARRDSIAAANGLLRIAGRQPADDGGHIDPCSLQTRLSKPNIRILVNPWEYLHDLTLSYELFVFKAFTSRSPHRSLIGGGPKPRGKRDL